MTATQKIYAILSAAAGVTALVPAARIKPPGDWQALHKPYLIHFPVSIEPTHCQDGLKALRIQRHQVSIFAPDEGSAGTIAAAVIAALDGQHDTDVQRIAFTNAYSLGYDTDLKVAHYAIDFEIAGALT